jgi:hypothetical protein
MLKMVENVGKVLEEFGKVSEKFRRFGEAREIWKWLDWAGESVGVCAGQSSQPMFEEVEACLGMKPLPDQR